MSNSPQNDHASVSEKTGRFSLHNLSAAFARLTGISESKSPPQDVAENLESLPESPESVGLEVLSPRMIVEGMLFVGNSDGRPLSSREMAAHLRDVSPREVEALIDELNDGYAQTNTTYRIVSAGQGYRFELGTKFDALRLRLLGRVREAKLTPKAIEVLSVVAYRQPIGAEDVTQIRGARSHALLNQLVRRGLLSLARSADAPRKPIYRTTERFNALFRIDSAEDLPNSAELDDL